MLRVEELRGTVEEEQADPSHQIVVKRVILAMRTHLCEPLALTDMADIACLSPYYFHRIFHSVIGIPPGEFHAALRLEAAKRLLLTTDLSVTDVCFEVGYSGLGSFTTRFTQLIGLPPRHLRQRAKNIVMPPLIGLPVSKSFPSPHALTGQIRTIHPFAGFIFIGLFSKPLPLGRPVRCTCLPSPGTYSIDNIPDGRNYVMVAALPFSDDPQSYLLPGASALVGMQGPLQIINNHANALVDIELRPPCLTDPPVITILPSI